MQLIWDGLCEAVRLVLSGDRLILSAAVRSLWISMLAVTLAAAIGLPIGELGPGRGRPGSLAAREFHLASRVVPDHGDSDHGVPG